MHTIQMLRGNLSFLNLPLFPLLSMFPSLSLSENLSAIIGQSTTSSQHRTLIKQMKENVLTNFQVTVLPNISIKDNNINNINSVTAMI